MKKLPILSIVIPTLNSGETIGKCLSSIPKRDEAEVIVVDGFSSDSTMDVCKKRGVKLYQVKGSRGKARNFGVEKARGKHVLFLDSDQTLSKGFIEECVSKLDDVDLASAPAVALGYFDKCKTISPELDTRFHKPQILRIIKRELLLKYPQDIKLQYGEDAKQMNQIGKVAKSTVQLKKPLYHLPHGFTSTFKRFLYYSKLPLSQQFLSARDRARMLPLKPSRITRQIKRWYYVLTQCPKYLFGVVLIVFTFSIYKYVLKRLISP